MKNFISFLMLMILLGCHQNKSQGVVHLETIPYEAELTSASIIIDVRNSQ
jgi:uncharacterized protein YcfL